jgi:nucleotide-binding universal stress UspA family protein
MTWKVKNILVPTDGSKKAELAVKPALDIARQKKAKIISICVLAAPFESSCYTGTGAAEGAQIIEDLKNDIAKENVERVVEKVKKGGVAAKAVITSGSPVDEILKAALKEKADLIVMGTKGKTGTKRVLGSVAASVISHAPCPVLAIREKKDALPFYERAQRM